MVKYYILCTDQPGDYCIWWRPNKSGYTVSLLDAAEAVAREGTVTPALVLRLAEKCRRLEAERDALRRAVEEIPGVIRKSGEPGEGGIDMTGGIPTCVYVGIGRERYDDDYELARESAAEARDDAARAVEHFVKQALARGAGERAAEETR